MSLSEIGIIVLASIGVFFTLVSAIGILRLPDVYARMHAASKASTLGVSCILLAAGLHYGDGQLTRMVILIALFFITGPIAATAMARAAYRTDPDKQFILHYDELAAAEAQQSESRRDLDLDPA
jgi:multicomponent Na+:H+ antiporter subunit G